ncbi:permease [Bacillus cereus]|uniref:Permease n=3 Tax=Bacillus cereus group TaxID=86661 RepID=A0A9W7UQS9_BACCE|nr:permease [Bacillus cereus]KAB2504658.1 FtsX-like permease family protein [Bacillus cereus]
MTYKKMFTLINKQIKNSFIISNEYIWIIIYNTIGTIGLYFNFKFILFIQNYFYRIRHEEITNLFLIIFIIVKLSIIISLYFFIQRNMQKRVKEMIIYYISGFIWKEIFWTFLIQYTLFATIGFLLGIIFSNLIMKLTTVFIPITLKIMNLGTIPTFNLPLWFSLTLILTINILVLFIMVFSKKRTKIIDLLKN